VKETEVRVARNRESNGLGESGMAERLDLQLLAICVESATLA